MAEGSDLKWRVTEIATCPICMEDFNNSRILPCVHTFCLECLQGHCKDKMVGDDVACPLCRSEFQIPDSGLEGLPHNFFLQNLIDARDASTQKIEVLCEVCAAENNEDEGETPSATMYCADCNQKLCAGCSRPHKVWRGGPHQVRALGAQLTAELIQQRASYCDQHKDERLKLYCHDCEINVCLMCCAVDHSGHKCADVGKVADEFIKLFDTHIASLSSRIDEFNVAITQVDAENTKFKSAVHESGTIIQQRGEMINEITKKHVAGLLEELQTVKSDGAKEASSRSEELKLAVTSLESLKFYLAELIAKGSPCDVTRAAKAMRNRASELLQTCVISSDYRAPYFSFTPTNIDDLTKGQNFIGHINMKTNLAGIIMLCIRYRLMHYIAHGQARFQLRSTLSVE